jgi:hypothetical protein
LEGSVTQDAAGRRNHSEEGRKDRLRFLQLVELDKCVEKSNSDEDATEISVLYVTLGGNVDGCKDGKPRKGSHESRFQAGCTQEDQK